MRSIATEQSVAALAAHISFGRLSEGYSDDFGRMFNRSKEDSSRWV